MPKSRNRNKKKSAYSAQRPTGRNRGTANWNVFLQEQAALQATTSQQSTASALPESFTTIREEPLIPSQSSSSTSLISLPASLSIPDQESCELDCQISELDPFTGSASSSETTGSVQRNEEDGTSNSQSSTSSTNVASAPAGRQKKINEKKPSNSKKRLEKPIPMVLKKVSKSARRRRNRRNRKLAAAQKAEISAEVVSQITAATEDEPRPSTSHSSEPPSASGVQQPVASVQEPVVCVQEPVACVQELTDDVQQPVADVQEPAPSVQQPSAGVQQPVACVQEPVASVQELTDDVQQLAADVQLPSASIQQPATDVQKPAADVQEPSASVQQPPADVQLPSASVQQPATDVQKPATDVQEPSASVQQPPADVQQPPADVQQPAADVQEPAANVQQPATSTHQSVACQAGMQGFHEQPSRSNPSASNLHSFGMSLEDIERLPSLDPNSIPVVTKYYTPPWTIPIPQSLTPQLAGTGFMLAKVHPSPETSPPPSRWFTPLFPMEETVFPIQARLVTHLTLRNSDVYDNPAAIGQTGVRPQFTRDVCIALDCEMVGIMDGRENMLARVSLVDMSGNCIYDTFVRAERPVVDYRTHVSGVRPVDEQNGARFQLVRRVVATIINNRILIGHALKNDLAVLGITVKRRFIRDTAYYRPLREPGWLHVTPSLKRLAQRLLNQTIQEGEHSSITDARVTMQIYLLHRNEWEKFLLRKFYDLL